MPNALRRGRVIRDPVHGYVEVPDELDPLVRCGAIQRLRHISQNSRSVAGFPSMTGTRYEHALGTMHLAIKAWGYCWQNTIPLGDSESDVTQDDFKLAVIRDVRAIEGRDSTSAEWVGMEGTAKQGHPEECPPEEGSAEEGSAEEGSAEECPLWTDFERRIGLVLGAVGLLHDVGHPPFSHLLEPFYFDEMTSIFGPRTRAAFDEYAREVTGTVQFHEWAGLRIFDAIPDEAFEVLPRALIRRVLADRTGSGWAYCLHSLIDGQFDVDRLDYLLRDAINAGTEFGAIDTTRLLQSLELHRPGPTDWRIGLGARAVSSFETLLIQRAQHYRWVVHHPASVAADAALKRCTEGVYELSRTSATDPSTDAALHVLRARLPDLDYISAVTKPARAAAEGREHCVDDHQCFTWLRAVRPALTSLAGLDNPAVRSTGGGEFRRKARTALALQKVFDTFALSPIPAWRNYQEFLARAEQNPVDVAGLIDRAGHDDPPPHYLHTAASRRAVTALLAELPARLNSALDRVLRPSGSDADLREAEQVLDRTAGRIDSCGGEGTWIVTHVPFLALQEDVAHIWRGNQEALLSDVSPYPLALAAIEIMRPRYCVFFVPFDGRAHEASTAQRRVVGRVFLETMARVAGGGAAPG